MGICDSNSDDNQNNAINNSQETKQNLNNSSKYFANTNNPVQDNLILNNNVIISETNQNLENTYQKIRKLGEGGFGEVWLVKHKVLGTEFALKIIEKGPYSNSQQIENEVNILKRLDHPFILKIVSVLDFTFEQNE